VPFYGVFKEEPDLSGIRAAVQGHYGEQDGMYPVDQARELEQQLRDKTGAAEVEFFYYPAGHAFHNDENLIGTYEPEHAAAAWARTLSFLRRHLGG
jgi:carboxymethylenebutenolidase